MTLPDIAFSELQVKLADIVREYIPEIHENLVSAGWIDPQTPIPVFLGPLELIPQVPCVVVSVTNASFVWGAVRCVDVTFNGDILHCIENIAPQKRNTFMGIFEGTLRAKLTAIPELQYSVETDGKERATVYDSFISACVYGEAASGAYYAARSSWNGKVWIVKPG